MATKTIEFGIGGMTCTGCATGIAKQFVGKPGVLATDVSHPAGNGTFTYDGDVISKEEIAATITASGHYEVTGEIAPGPAEGTAAPIPEALTPATQSSTAPRTGTTDRPASATPSAELAGHGPQGTFFDLVIVGGGSAAFAAALHANEQGLSTLVVNGGLPLGGTCVNVGCVPSKYLIRAAESFHHAGHSAFAGVQAGRPALEFAKVIREKRDLVNQLRGKKYEALLADLENVRVVAGWAEFVDARTIRVKGPDGKETEYTGLKFIVATGAAPLIPAIEGLDKVPYFTSESLFEHEELPESLTIIGAGYIALEIAQAYQRFGSRVTVVQRSAHVLSTQTADVAEELTRHLRAEGLTILTGAAVEHVATDGPRVTVRVRVNGSTQEIGSTHLLLAAGTRPNTSTLGLDKAGVTLTPSGHVQVNAQLETSAANIYAVGDVTPNPAYVYAAAYEGKLAVQNAFAGAGRATDFTALPWVVFTDPQVAGVGLDERGAEAAGLPVEVRVLPLSEVPRNVAAKDTRGFIKLLRHAETDVLLGARIVAPEGGELLSPLTLALKGGLTVADLANTFYPYLTQSEGIKLAALSFSQDVAKLSCCAS
ncbi:mercury(II) reductase [Hymenobacter antarcticus]|uniref:Mercuric reductase n=1 Tax=Hymenobacter antarcticus TaxID=486270 RepID=A0ABP7Q635_9BACT